MRIKTTISVAMIMLGIWICFPLTGKAADSALENMRSTVGNSKADLENYRKLLVELEKAKLKAKDQVGATAAKLEIIKLDRELAAMDGGSSRRSSRSEAATDKVSADKAAAEKAAEEKAAASRAIADKAAAAKAATDKVAADKAAAEKAVAEKAAASKSIADKAAAAKAATDMAAADKAAAEEKAAAAKVANEKAAAEKAAAKKAAVEKAAAEKAAAEKAAAEKTAAEKTAAEKAAAEKAATEKAAAQKVAAQKAAAQKAEAEKVAAQKAAAEKAAAARAAAEEAATMKAADEAQKIADMRTQLRELIAQGNEKLNSGDVLGAREIKGKVNVIQEELTRLGAPAGSAIDGKSALDNGLALATAAPQPAPTPAAPPVASAAPAPAAPTPAAEPAPQALTPILRSPQTHVSSVQGLAGAHNYSQNNVYVFNLNEVGPTATFSYYATGRRSKDTSGNIWLITPGGRRERVAQWKSGQFEVASSEVSSYTMLNPVTVDISGLVKGPGAYQVEFEWTDGIAPLVIYRVEIRS